jgi:hypothetical protein
MRRPSAPAPFVAIGLLNIARTMEPCQMTAPNRLSSSACAGQWSARISILFAMAAFASSVCAQVFNHPSNEEVTINPVATRKVELANDAANLLPLTTFYDFSSPLGSGRPGDLLRSEAASGLKAGWRSNPSVQAFFKRNSVTGAISGPMLILGSTDDESVPASTQDDAVARLCGGGATIEYVRYAGYGLDHDGIERATTGLRLRWIRDRFAALPVESNCASLKLSGKTGA